MNRSKIEWTDYTLNPVKGKCPMACSYCYARRMYDRFKWNPAIRFDDSIITKAWWPKRKGVKVFVGSTMELFGDWIEDSWMHRIFHFVHHNPDCIFQFLTKRPWELPRWNPWPDNCHVGATVTDFGSYIEASGNLREVEAKVRFISAEPLLGSLCPPQTQLRIPPWIDWIIVGAQTQPLKLPKLEWVQEIAEIAGRAAVPVFLKNNLRPLFREHVSAKHNTWALAKRNLYKGELWRQEFPE